MITLKPIAARLLFLTAVSVFSMMCANQGSRNTHETEDADSTVHVSDSTSIGYELAECDCDDPDSSTNECCVDLRKLEAEITLCMDGTVTTTGSCPRYMVVTKVQPPMPCPKAQCTPFLEVSRVCFFSEKPDGAVEILVNNEVIGKATDVSYNSKTKERTVFFDLKKNFKNANADGQNVMVARFPVTYRKSGKAVKAMLVVTEPF